MTDDKIKTPSASRSTPSPDQKMPSYAILGPRNLRGTDYEDFDYLAEKLDSFVDIGEIIYGGGKGVEALARDYAVSRNIKHTIVKPDLANATTKDPVTGKLVERPKNHDEVMDSSMKDVFRRRNLRILAMADYVVLFWDGTDRPSIETLQDANKLGKEVIVIPMERAKP